MGINVPTLQESQPETRFDQHVTFTDKDRLQWQYPFEGTQP